MARNKNRIQSKKHSVNEQPEPPYGLNEVDDFASKREKLLLSESTMRDAEEEEDILPDEEEEEVLAMSTDESSEEDEDGEEEDEYEEEEEKLDGEKAYRKVFGRKLDLNNTTEAEGGTMLDNENAWGSTKGEYYGADDLDDDETAKDIEEEALRQRKKHLEDMNMNDYLDDELDDEWSKDAKAFDIGEFKETTKQNGDALDIKNFHSMDPEVKQEYLNTFFPEFLPLSKELTKLLPVLENLKKKEESEITLIKKIALSSYIGVLSSYFGVLLHEFKNNEEFSTMRDHPVMEMLLTAKEVWRQASSLPDDMNLDNGSETDGELAEEHISDNNEDENLDESDAARLTVLTSEDTKRVDDDEENEDNVSASSSANSDTEEGEEDEEDVDLDDFEEYVALSRVNRKKSGKEVEEQSQHDSDLDDYNEGDMADVDAQEKKARRKTLRFYTSKIDQQQNKKIDRLKGDDDIPYKERLFERQQRLIEEARKRGLHSGNGEDLDTKDFGSDDEATSKLIKSDGEKDYFNLIQERREHKKDSRREAHKAAVKAAKEGKLAELAEGLGEDGKRAINYQILKNKGLTPKRKKDNRNSRVKKRKKFEKAQKKLKSVRAVYSGGQDGAYEGEKTGIKKNLVKSVKFKM
ncbi:hypothetical protein HG535_0E04980 [Zygotorulaspora mrakii]|uniref:Sas10 C-terminal domain-containing protein n=1 Tax=Zygotorulaspora mrakii TaxID=42260 RepID=A0A7H9B4X5_ZYGMR|nr:uncharacterized protein HG535_0E04980 [Zygotorulaspora mrakii]QLG73414.1 hypothetical protein HG535_0E04980 [Zygotorulaspora mrakii]